MRVGPVAITNGVFGNRPHCIYRGFCLQGCKVNAKASPLITHLPDAIEHGVEVRADCDGRRGSRSTTRPAAAPASRTSATAASASSAPPRSRSAATRSRRRGCCSTRRRSASRTGSRNDDDQVGRYVMVQGATQVAGALPASCCACTRRRRRRSPRSSSTRPTSRRGFARGFSIQTVGAAADRLGRARARRRPLGPGAARVHARLQPLDGARRALRAAAAAGEPRHARRRDRRDTACRSRASTTRQCDNDRANIAYAKQDARGDLGGRRRAGHAHDRPLRAPRRRLPHGLHRRRPVVDGNHRVWGVDNLFVADGSVMPTQGAANPALAIMALADRAAGLLARKRA